MFSNKTKKLIIVCDEKTKDYANYLRQLISTNDDTEDEIVGVADGSVDAAVWLEKDYIANSATISSNEHILFIGNSKTAKSESKFMNILFDKYSMKYGWLGKRAFLTVEKAISNEKDYSKFIDMCHKNQQEIEIIAVKESSDKDKKAKSKKHKAGKLLKVAALTSAVMSPITAGYAAVGAVAQMKIAQKDVLEQQYRALTVMFYLNDLQKFLEG